MTHANIGINLDLSLDQGEEDKFNPPYLGTLVQETEMGVSPLATHSRRAALTPTAVLTLDEEGDFDDVVVLSDKSLSMISGGAATDEVKTSSLNL